EYPQIGSTSRSIKMAIGPGLKLSPSHGSAIPAQLPMSPAPSPESSRIMAWNGCGEMSDKVFEFRVHKHLAGAKGAQFQLRFWQIKKTHPAGPPVRQL